MSDTKFDDVCSALLLLRSSLGILRPLIIVTLGCKAANIVNSNFTSRCKSFDTVRGYPSLINVAGPPGLRVFDADNESPNKD